MKRVLLFVLILLLVGSNLAAASSEDSSRPLPGDRLYFVRSFIESFRLLLTRNAESRAELLSSYAETRALEIQQLVAQNSSEELILRTIERQERILAELAKIVDNGKLSDEAYNKVLASQATALDVLANNIAKVSERAQEAIAENIVRRSEKLLQQVQKRQDKVKNAIAEIVDDALINAVEQIGEKANASVQAAKNQIVSDLEYHLDQAKSKISERVQGNVADLQNRLKQVKDKLPKKK